VRQSRSGRRLRGVSVFAFAVAGLVLGHALAYVLAIPDPHHRNLVMTGTGHDYVPVATQLGLILAFAAVAARITHGMVARREGTPSGFGPLATRLMAVQVVAFGGQEIVERVAAGAPLVDLTLSPPLPAPS
jgi:hypothetical protein